MAKDLFFDATPLTTRERTREGFLRGKAVVTRVGIQRYPRRALNLDGDPNEMVSLYRTPETVFHEDTAASLRLMPLTVGHPAGGVNPQNARSLSVGAVGDRVERDDDGGLVISIGVHGAEGLRRIDDGYDQISGGYRMRYVVEDGEVDGQQYQVRTEGPMLYNHLALELAGRLGNGARVMDTSNPPEGGGTVEDGKKQTPAFDVDKFTKTFSETFSETIAPKIGETLAGGIIKILDAREKQAKGTVDADEQRRQEIRDGAHRRASILANARLVMDEEDFAKVCDSDDREILEAAVDDTVKDAKDASDDYLVGVLDMKVRAARDGGGSGGSGSSFYGRLRDQADTSRGRNGNRAGGGAQVTDSEVSDARKEMIDHLRNVHKQPIGQPAG